MALCVFQRCRSKLQRSADGSSPVGSSGAKDRARKYYKGIFKYIIPLRRDHLQKAAEVGRQGQDISSRVATETSRCEILVGRARRSARKDPTLKLLRNCSSAIIALIATSSAIASAATTGDQLSLARQIPVVSDIFAKPRIGLRVGGGQWHEFMLDGGVDVTLKVPLLPLPALRFDAEVWGKPSNFGKDRRGNCLSLLGVQSLALGYYGAGPAYYFSDDNGSHSSGFGAKFLGGVNLPHGLYAEAGVIVGPSPTPIFITIGQSF